MSQAMSFGWQCPIMQDDEPMQDPVIAADGHTYERSGIAQWLVNRTPTSFGWQCPVMQDGKPMQDPVIAAADGHTYVYERSGIPQWLVNHTTSPVSRAEMDDKKLLPNHQLKSMIEQWREDQKGVTARLKRLEALLAKIHFCVSHADALSALSALSDFIAESETPIQIRQLKRIRILLEGDDELWSDAVKGALEVVEAQCQSTTQTLHSNLRKAKLLHGVSSRAHAKVVAKRESKEKELEGSEEKVKRLEAELKEEKNKVVRLKNNLEYGYKTEPYRKIEEEYEEEVENIQRVLRKDAEQEEEEEEAQGGGKKKRKRGAGESSGRATEQAKPDMDVVFVEGLEWYKGLNFRKKDRLRGQMLIEAAAEEGVAIAEAECIWRGWGGREEDNEISGSNGMVSIVSRPPNTYLTASNAAKKAKSDDASESPSRFVRVLPRESS
jgi:hypothetical protein